MGDFHGEIPIRLKKRILKEKENIDLILGLGDYSGIEDWRVYLKYLFKEKAKGIERKNIMNPEEFFGEKKFKQLIKKDYKKGEKVLLFLDKLKIPFFSIFGNGDEGWYNHIVIKSMRIEKGRKKFLKKLKNWKDLTYKNRRFEKLGFVGFGGFMHVVSNYDSRKKADREILKRINKQLKESEKKFNSILRKSKKRDIFVLHYTPKGVFDKISDKKNPYYGKSAGIDFFRKAILKYKPKLVFCGHMHEYQGMRKLGKSVVINPGAAVDGKGAIVETDKKGNLINAEFFN